MNDPQRFYTQHMNLDYATFWPEEETEEETNVRPIPTSQTRPVHCLRKTQRGTAVMRGIGPHVAWYFLLGAILPFFSLVLLGLLSMFVTMLIEAFF